MNKRCYKLLTKNLGKIRRLPQQGTPEEKGVDYILVDLVAASSPLPLYVIVVCSLLHHSPRFPSFFVLIAKPSYTPPWHGLCPASLRPIGTRKQHTSYRKGKHMLMLGGLTFLQKTWVVHDPVWLQRSSTSDNAYGGTLQIILSPAQPSHPKIATLCHRYYHVHPQRLSYA
jgi:hypothetical protein